MIYFLLILIFILFIITIILYSQNNKIKKRHLYNIQKLEGIISSLYQKQLYLNDKVALSTDYNSNYRLKIKNISEEIVEHQNMFINIIDKKDKL